MESMANDPELLKEFLTETNELLGNLDNDLINFETNPQNEDLLNLIFRAVHTIKGTSRFLEFEQLVELSHASEHVLCLLRNKERIVTPGLMDVLLESIDKLKILVAQVQNDNIGNIDLGFILKVLSRIKSGSFQNNTLEPESLEQDESQEKDVKLVEKSD
jgi:two-component system chemotaxis sensor kinase CheA